MTLAAAGVVAVDGLVAKVEVGPVARLAGDGAGDYAVAAGAAPDGRLNLPTIYASSPMNYCGSSYLVSSGYNPFTAFLHVSEHTLGISFYLIRPHLRLLSLPSHIPN